MGPAQKQTFSGRVRGFGVGARLGRVPLHRCPLRRPRVCAGGRRQGFTPSFAPFRGPELGLHVAWAGSPGMCRGVRLHSPAAALQNSPQPQHRALEAGGGGGLIKSGISASGRGAVANPHSVCSYKTFELIS